MPLVATPSAAHESSVLRGATWIAFGIALITDFGYWLIIRIQENQPPDLFTVPFVAGYIALMGALLGTSVTSRERVVRLRPALRAGAAAGLLAMGVLALMSIGLALVLSGIVAGVAAVGSLRPFRVIALLSQVVAVVVAVAVLIAGFEVSARIIVCPQTGSASGGGPGFVTGGYHYECVDGQLHMHSGFCNGGGSSVDAQGNVTVTSTC